MIVYRSQPCDFSSTRPNQTGAGSVVTGMKRYPLAAAAAGLLILIVASGAASAPASSASTATAPTTSAPTTSAPTTSAPTQAPASIVISAFEYSGELTVKAGQQVTVTNLDPAVPVPVMHSLTDKQTALFNTGPIQPAGGTASFTAPAKAGSYPFGCLFHLFMAGTLVVQD
jgi:plastocyanin